MVQYLFSVPHSHTANTIEMFFKSNKTFIKIVLKFDELEQEVKNAIYKVKKENYKNYYTYTYKKKI